MKKMEDKGLYTNVYSGLIHNRQKLKTIQISSNSKTVLTTKLWYVHTMDYYSAIKRSELFIHTP